MKKIKEIAGGLNKAYPYGNEPFKIATRLSEECGEVAKEINHWERTGVKVRKYGEPSKEKLAREIHQVIICALQVALYYNVEDELDKVIEESHQHLKDKGLLK